MNVSLTRELVDWVQAKVRSGRYQSASEVIREALRLLEETDNLRRVRLRRLRKEIAVGIEDLDRGRSAPLDRKLLEDIKKRGRRRMARERL